MILLPLKSVRKSTTALMQLYRVPFNSSISTTVASDVLQCPSLGTYGAVGWTYTRVAPPFALDVTRGVVFEPFPQGAGATVFLTFKIFNITSSES